MTESVLLQGVWLDIAVALIVAGVLYASKQISDSHKNLAKLVNDESESHKAIIDCLKSHNEEHTKIIELIATIQERNVTQFTKLETEIKVLRASLEAYQNAGRNVRT